MTRSTKEKNVSARTSLEKSFENTFLTPTKNKYIVQEKNIAGDKKRDLPKSTQPTFVTVRKNSSVDVNEPKKKSDLPKSTQPTYVSVRRKSTVDQKESEEAEVVNTTYKPIQMSIRRKSKVKDELLRENDKPSIEDVVQVITESRILEIRENREELLSIINNFLKFKQ